MRRTTILALALVAAVSAGCSMFDNRDDNGPTPAPTATGVQQLAGTWASISSTTALPSTCTSFRWTVTEISGNSGSGSFELSCSAGGNCYANCDESTASPILNVADFTCFLQRFASGESYANCDGSTTEPILNVADFTCFLQQFAAGCP